MNGTSLRDEERPRGLRAPEIDRREFMKLMGASLALAGISGCTRQPREEIVPYVRQPEQIVPGRPLYFATAVTIGGVAMPVLVESHDGRPTKIEGNPEHPASLGASDAFTQAELLGLYDPDRSQVVTSLGEIRPWSAFVAAVRTALVAQRDFGGAGIRILTETVTSPALAAQIRSVLAEFPEARWVQYEPVNRDYVYDGARLAFGEVVETIYNLEHADVIVSLDADFLFHGASHLRNTRAFARRRRPEDELGMNRHYVIESSATNTGSMADHRVALPARDIEHVARAIAARLNLSVATPGGLDVGVPWLDAMVRDLREHRGRSVVLVGDLQSAATHAIAHAINHRLGNVGRTVRYTEPIVSDPTNQVDALRTLTEEMRAAKVSMLLILGGNPVYTAPVDLRFASALGKVPFSAHLSLYDDETSAHCLWHVPAAHALESWGDARTFDGPVTIVQPLIAPLYDGKTPHDVLALLSSQPDRSAYDVVREYWRAEHPDDFERFWRRALHDGIVPGSAPRERTPQLRNTFGEPAKRGEGVEVVLRPDPTVYDGRFANNGWLQELPKAQTRLTWDNAVLVSPALAQRFSLVNEDIVEIVCGEQKVQGPVWVTFGQPAESVTIHLGYGRTRAGKVGSGIGFNAYQLRVSGEPWFRGAEIRKTGRRQRLVTTQEHHRMEGRPLVRSATLAHFREHPDFAQHQEHQPSPDETLYPRFEYDGYAWGMAIDLSACVGCGACVTACQAENNIPIVGKDEVARGHEMHWLRVDRYYEGDPDTPRIFHQPVPCMHCENAPCEVVCPVAATVHSSEGLNDMVYNRCVGTKYCLNNCPYKVRRFNWFLYTDWGEEVLKLGRNPDVTVRSRGVMEKCTYCVQRINAARIQAKKENRRIRDGEVLTACQQACPAEAIVFGDINDRHSRVRKLKAQPRNYALLASLNTRPRTTYLAHVRNPNPEIEAGKGPHA